MHDWIQEFHKEWLEPRPKGFIPDLADVADLIRIERELAKKDLDAATEILKNTQTLHSPGIKLFRTRKECHRCEKYLA